MEALNKIAGYVVLGLQVLVVFVLAFENRIELPPALEAVGRMHPMLLHFPIALVFLVTLFVFTEKSFGTHPVLIDTLVNLLALTTSATALMGLFLSLEGGYEESHLALHKWLGIALSLFTWMLVIVPRSVVRRALLASSCVVLVIAGHFGATLTHGENFVTAPLLREPARIRTVSDSTTVFSGIIEPVLEAKCYGCHNGSKSKGDLVLTSLASIDRGGKHGKIWVPGHSANSLIVKRILLPMDAREHMPPKDKAQLSVDEIAFISRWIDRGADTGMRISELPASDTLRVLAQTIINRYYQRPSGMPLYDFASVNDQAVRELNIPNRSVFRLAANEPALAADFYLAESYSEQYLKDLRSVSGQLVHLNLANMPVKDEDLNIIAEFPNLEKLILNNTLVTGSTFGELKKLKRLRILALSGTRVKANSLQALSAIPTLRTVFIWNTPLAETPREDLLKSAPHINWEAGFIADEKERLKLNAPLLANDINVLDGDERVMLKHNLPGTRILYSVDGTEPDSISGSAYTAPIDIGHFTVLKTRAVKEGWLASEVAEYVLYKQGMKPDAAGLLTPAEAKFEGEGITTLTDGLKGMPDFYKDPSWVGFRNGPMSAVFTFDAPRAISVITISYARNVWAMCMPPETVEVWAGPDARHLKRVAHVVPAQPTGWVSNRIEGVNVPLPPGSFACYKVIATPLAKLPAFRNEKKEKGWLMVDEIFFN